MQKRCILIVTLGIVGTQASPVLSAEPSAKTRVPVAVVFSKQISADELEPNAALRNQEAAQLSQEQFNAWLVGFRQERLTGMIFSSLAEQYCRGHNCEPTNEDVAAFVKSGKTSKAANQRKWAAERASLSKEMDSPNLTEARKREIASRLYMLETFLFAGENFTGSISPEQEAAAQRRVADQFIRAWKFNKALYQQYGGRVIFQQAGMEPLDAYRAWLKDHEHNGDFVINDAALHEGFWRYFVSEAHTFVPIESFRKESGMADPWEKPWWLVEEKKTPVER